MSNDPEDECEVRYPETGVDTAAVADAVKGLVMGSLVSPRRIEIWSEGGMPKGSHKQIGFSIWYTTRARVKEAFAEGEPARLEMLLQDECIMRGFPASQRERIYVDVDSHEALARLMGREPEFREWLKKVDPQSEVA